MRASGLRYAPLPRPGACCETCGRPFGCANSAVACQRCSAVCCRRCFSRSCVLAIGGVSFALPVVASRHGVCDACHPDDEREATFVERHAPFLANGVLAQRVPTGALASLLAVSVGAAGGAGGREPVWLSLDAPARQLRWRTMQLVNNVPKEAGAVGVGEVGSVVGTSAGGEPLLVNPAAAGGGGGGPPPTGVRLLSPRGVTLLSVQCSDARQARLLLEAVTEAVAVAALPHCTAFPPPAGAPSAAPAAAAAAAATPAGGSGGGSPSASAGAQARQARAAEREAFKARLGPVGMTHTARILAGGGGDGAVPGSGPGRPSAPASAGAVGGSASGAPVVGHARPPHPPPPSGAAAAAAHSIRTGNLDADRALHSAATGLAGLGASAKGLFAGFASSAAAAATAASKLPPPPDARSAGATAVGGAGRQPPSSVTTTAVSTRTNVGRGATHPAGLLVAGGPAAPTAPPLPAALHRATSFIGTKLSAALTSLSASVPPATGPAGGSSSRSSGGPAHSSSSSSSSGGGGGGGFGSLSAKLASRLDSSWLVDGPPPR